MFTEAHERLMDVYERLDEMDSDRAMVRAAELLHGTSHYVRSLDWCLYSHQCDLPERFGKIDL